MKIKKTLVVLFLIVIVALILRLIAAQDVEIVPDEIVYSLLPWKIISAQRLSTAVGGPLFSYLTDISYTIFGEVNATSTRFPSIFFGSLTVILIYLCSLKIFGNKKAALFGAFLFAVSGYILENNTEPDMTAFFFALLSVYFFLFFLDGKSNYLYLSTIFLTLAVLCKSLPLLFLPIYLFIFILHAKGYFTGNQNTKVVLDLKLLKTIFGCLVIAILLLMPTIMYNYLEFKNNGKTDTIVYAFLGIGENFYPGMSQIDPWDFPVMLNFFKNFFAKFFMPDPLIVGLGILGIFLVVQQRRAGSLILIISALLLLAYVGGITGSASHYLWVPLVLSIFAGYSIEKLSHYLHTKCNLNLRTISFVFILIITAVSLYQFNIIISKESANMELREYSIENIPKDSIIVMDPRIYFGSYSWILHERHYLNGMLFQELLNQLGNSASPKIEVPLYYIECSGDTTCGWKQEDYDRVNSFAESLSTYFKDNLGYTGEIDANHHFFIYQGFISVPPEIYQSIDRTHAFIGYSMGWKYPDQNIDEYPREVSNKYFHVAGLLFLYLDLLLALLTIPLVLVLLFKGEKSGKLYQKA